MLLGKNDELDRAYKQHFAFVWRSLARLGVPPAALDDATQDVFIIALRRAAEFSGRSSYRTWLFGIAANIAREQRRNAQRTQHEPLDQALSSASAERSPLEQASDAQALRFVERFLATLDDAQREVFILSELERMPSPEIAEAVGAKLNTVYSRLRLAREAFARMIAQLHAPKP